MGAATIAVIIIMTFFMREILSGLTSCHHLTGLRQSDPVKHMGSDDVCGRVKERGFRERCGAGSLCLGAHSLGEGEAGDGGSGGGPQEPSPFR